MTASQRQTVYWVILLLFWPSQARLQSNENGLFTLPTFAGQEPAPHGFTTAPKATTLVRGQSIESIGHAIYLHAINYWPASSFFRGEIALEQHVATQPYTRYSSELGASLSGRSITALVARVPLYSPTELDREREREYNRRAHAAQASGAFASTYAEKERLMRQLQLMSSLEKRARDRVLHGVADTSEQVHYMERVGEIEGELIRLKAQFTQAELALLSFCSEDKVQNFREYLQSIMPPW